MAYAVEKSAVFGAQVLSSVEQRQSTFTTVVMPSFSACQAKTRMAVIALDRRELATKPIALLKQMARQKGINANTRDQLIDALAGGAPTYRSQPSYSSFAAPSSGQVSAEESVLQSKSLSELRALAKQKGLRGDTKAEIIKLLVASGSVATGSSASSVSAPTYSTSAYAPVSSGPVAKESVQDYERRLKVKPLAKLRAVARLRGITGVTRDELIKKLLAYHAGTSFTSSSASYSAPAASYSSPAPAAAASPSYLESLPLSELRAMAKSRGLRGDTKKELIKLLSGSSGSPAAPAAPSYSSSYSNGASASYAAPAASISERDLATKPLSQLRALAAQRGIRGNTRQELIRALSR